MISKSRGLCQLGVPGGVIVPKPWSSGSLSLQSKMTMEHCFVLLCYCFGRCCQSGRCPIAMLDYPDGVIGSRSQRMLGRTKQQRSLQRSRTVESLEHAQQTPKCSPWTLKFRPLSRKSMHSQTCYNVHQNAMYSLKFVHFGLGQGQHLPFKSSQSCVVFCRYASPNKCTLPEFQFDRKPT